MPLFKVKLNTRIYAPHKWTARNRKLFGDCNEGSAPVEAATADDAVKAFAAANTLNPFYLMAEPAA